MGAPVNHHMTKEEFKAEGMAYACLSMPVGAAIGYLGAVCFTAINPAAGAWLGLGIASMNAVGIFTASKFMDLIQPSTCKALTAYTIVWLTSTLIGAVMVINVAELTLTAAEVMALIAADLALVGIGLGVLIAAAAVFYCAGQYFCPDVIENIVSENEHSVKV